MQSQPLLSWVLKLVMLGLIGVYLAEGNILTALFGALVLAVSFVPSFLARSLRVHLPALFDVVLTLWLTLSLAGEFYLYARFWWWDEFLHFGGSAVLAFLAFVIIYGLHLVGTLRLSIPLTGFFTFTTAMMLGAIWEIAEFWVWRLTGRDSLGAGGDPLAGLYDTLTDLQLDLVGGLVMSLLAMWYVARTRDIRRHPWLRPFLILRSERVLRAARRVRERWARRVR